ncbi:MAG: tRNA uridine-5-carboxymethylaminomethyl(34) synthesis GTPase MnmE [bacterium]|nr:tRNA uridine-5-carboxymethylaminomethyl(34) synthesis GTPase MnmE [bacterium]
MVGAEQLHSREDTIAAISTPAGEGGIGIIRISGGKALSLAQNIFHPKYPQKDFDSHRLYLGEIRDPADGDIVDECLMTFMKSPNSFTREDVVELHCHGGTVVLQRTMELLMRNAIRQAEPGEFTKRAFLNGRIDLSQAEAIIDVIRAKTERGLRLAQVQLKGGLKDELALMRGRLIHALAILEAYIDFPEEELDPNALAGMDKDINSSISFIDKLLSTYEEGRVLREGIHVVIAGRPNVGKSSLLNALLMEKRAIVTSIPGTTRDTIEEVINLKGIPINLIDTAGIRETEDIVEKEGIKKARDKLNEADLILYMMDERGLNADDFKVIESVTGRKSLFIINKIDIISDERANEIKSSLPGDDALSISLKAGKGLEELKDAIFNSVMKHKADRLPSVIISRKRHKVSLEFARKSLERSINGINKNLPLELIAIDIKEALNNIAEVAGETTPDDVLDKIFSDFCIGK